MVRGRAGMRARRIEEDHAEKERKKKSLVYRQHDVAVTLSTVMLHVLINKLQRMGRCGVPRCTRRQCVFLPADADCSTPLLWARGLEAIPVPSMIHWGPGTLVEGGVAPLSCGSTW